MTWTGRALDELIVRAAGACDVADRHLERWQDAVRRTVIVGHRYEACRLLVTARRRRWTIESGRLLDDVLS